MGETLDYIQMADTCITLFKNAANEVLLIKQYRPVFDGFFLELPGGSNEKDETLEETAVREFIEETGLIPANLNLVMSIILSIGSSSEKAHIFHANEIQVSKTNHPERGIELHWINILAIPEMIKNGQIVDAKTIVALQRMST